MTVYEQGGILCSAMRFRGDTEKDSAEMYDSMKDVAAKLFVGHKPKVAIDGTEAQLTLCDPGSSAKAPKVDAVSIFTAPTARSLLLGIALEDPDVSTEQADCAVDMTINRLTVPEMTNLLRAPSREDASRNRSCRTSTRRLPPAADSRRQFALSWARHEVTRTTGESRGNGYG